MRIWHWSLGINVVLLLIREGVVNMSMGIYEFRGEEVDDKLWGWMNILEGIYCQFKLFLTGVVVVVWDKVHDWSEIWVRARGETVEASN